MPTAAFSRIVPGFPRNRVGRFLASPPVVFCESCRRFLGRDFGCWLLGGYLVGVGLLGWGVRFVRFVWRLCAVAASGFVRGTGLQTAAGHKHQRITGMRKSSRQTPSAVRPANAVMRFRSLPRSGLADGTESACYLPTIDRRSLHRFSPPWLSGGGERRICHFSISARTVCLVMLKSSGVTVILPWAIAEMSVSCSAASGGPAAA